MSAHARLQTISASDDTVVAPQDDLATLVQNLERHARALAEKPNDLDTIVEAAEFCVQIGKIEEASKLYVQAMTLAPDVPAGFIGMSQVLRGQAMHAEAIDLLKEAIGRNPESASLWRELGEVMRDAGDTANATTFLDEAARLEGNLTIIRNAR
jgi:cytochrome c-type biogenesis protein CcmH/NrfG